MQQTFPRVHVRLDLIHRPLSDLFIVYNEQQLTSQPTPVNGWSTKSPVGTPFFSCAGILNPASAATATTRILRFMLSLCFASVSHPSAHPKSIWPRMNANDTDLMQDHHQRILRF